MNYALAWIARAIGYESRRSPWRERIVSGFGGFIAVLLVLQVREVIAIEARGDEGRRLVKFRIVAGRERRRSGQTGLLEFSRWAKHRVERDENTWRRI